MLPRSVSESEPRDVPQDCSTPGPSQTPVGRRWCRVFSFSSFPSEHHELVALREGNEPSQEEIVELYGDREERWDDNPQVPNEAARPGPSSAPDGSIKDNPNPKTHAKARRGKHASRQPRPTRKTVRPNTLSRNVRATSEADQSKALFTAIQSILTPRGILLLKILERQLELTWKSQAPNEPSSLDRRLTLGEVIKFAGALDANPELMPSESTWLRLCDMCRVPQFQGLHLPPSAGEAGLTPFLQSLYQFQGTFNELRSSRLGSTPCCSRTICDSCCIRAITESIARDFWHGHDAQDWLRCPFQTCQSRLPVRYNVELAGMLSWLQDPQVIDQIVVQYARVSRYRAALGALEPQPTAAGLQRAAELHSQLQQHGRMKGFLDFRQPFREKVEVLPVDSADGSETFQVPIFVDLIIPSQSLSPDGRDCIVCAETIPDITDGSPEEEARWEATISAFPGGWTHLVRSFVPTSSLPTCSAEHALDICRNCLSRHLTVQLESRGRGVSESLGLTCPSPGCRHIYTDSELRIIASPETFARYDKLRLLSYLATLPDFRWCLREGCNSGQVYDFPASPPLASSPQLQQRNRVLCEECGFAMCFTHQTPWHEGRDCIEYDADRGDPQLAATRAWIRANTKACPGCQAPVEKGNGCFHMTCQVCRFEFCWECLADWKQIIEVHPVTNVRKYRRDKHAVGCYFRSGNAPAATMLVGRTVQEATRW